jgi:hypothetical protein
VVRLVLVVLVLRCIVSVIMHLRTVLRVLEIRVLVRWTQPVLAGPLMCHLLERIWSVLVQVCILICFGVTICARHIPYSIRRLRLKSIARCPWAETRPHGDGERFMFMIRSIIKLVGRRLVPLW